MNMTVCWAPGSVTWRVDESSLFLLTPSKACSVSFVDSLCRSWLLVMHLLVSNFSCCVLCVLCINCITRHFILLFHVTRNTKCGDSKAIEQYLSKYIQQVCLSWKSCARSGDTIQSRGGWKIENFGTPGQPLLNEVMLFFSCHLVGFDVMNGLAVSLSVPNYQLVWTGVCIDRRMRKMYNFPDNWRHTKSRLLLPKILHL
jgi:hypothetical protein